MPSLTSRFMISPLFSLNRLPSRLRLGIGGKLKNSVEIHLNMPSDITEFVHQYPSYIKQSVSLLIFPAEVYL